MTVELLSIKEFGRRVGAHYQAIRNAIDRGHLTLMPQKDGRMVLVWPEAEEEWKRRPASKMQKPTEARGERMSWADAKARKDMAAAEIAELELGKRKGMLLPREHVEREAFACARRTRDAVLNIANRISDELAATSDRHAVHTLLTRELTAALEELAGTDWNEVPAEAPTEEEGSE